MTAPTDYKALAEAVICKADCDCSIECRLARTVLALDAERTAWRKLAEDNDRIAMEETTKRETLETEDQELRAALEFYADRKNYASGLTETVRWDAEATAREALERK